MKRSSSQELAWRTYRARHHAAVEASLAEPEPPSESWWIGLTRDAFSVRAAKELERMQGSQFGKLHKLITASGLAYDLRKRDDDTTAELEA